MIQLFVFLLAAACTVVAQTVNVIDFSKLPTCAQAQCVILAQAEANCVPPAAPVTNQQTYQSCICQSALLTSLNSGGQLCQQTGCSPDDASKISQYYQDLCKSPPAAAPAPGGTTTTLATSTKTSATSTNTATGTPAAGAGTVSTSDKPKSWWAGHYQWVVMVIVIGIAIIVFWVGGVYLRRHFQRKHDAQRANLAARDAPYVPSTPASRSLMSTGVTPQQMTMSGARSSTITVEGGVGGIAPQRGPMRSRSRTNTLQSLTMGNSSRTNVASQPVVWGPHQHLAQGNGNGSPVNSVPPSPTSAIGPPNPLLRNSQAMRSEPRFVQFRNTPTSPLSGDPRAHPDGDSIVRPNTTGTGRVGNVRTHSLNTVRSDPTLIPQVEPQTAEILEASPQKPSPQKLTKHNH